MILNKIDLVSEEEAAKVVARLKSINGSAPIVKVEHSKVSVDNVLNLRAFDLKKTLDMDPEFLHTHHHHH